MFIEKKIDAKNQTSNKRINNTKKTAKIKNNKVKKAEEILLLL